MSANLPVSNTVKSAFTDNSLAITYVFDSDISAFDQSTITYSKTKGVVKSAAEAGKTFDKKDSNSFTFNIPSSYYADAESLEFSMTLKKADATAMDSSKSIIDLSREVRLRKILTNQPTFVQFAETLIQADDRIGVRFVTNNAGKIKVTINGISAPSPQISPKVDKTHDFVFSPLQPSTEYTFKAEVLQMDDETKVIESVRAAEPAEIGKTFKTTNIGKPTVTVADLKLSPDNIIIPIRSNQDVYAEVAYTPVDSTTGAPRKRQSLTTINTTPLTGECSGTELVAGDGNLHTITIPNLVAGSTYKIEIAFKNRIGIKADLIDSEFTRTLPTVPVVTIFDFAEDIPIEAKVSPLGIDVTWTATDNPTDATARYLRDEGIKKTTLTEAKDGGKIDGKKVTAHFEAEDVINKVISLQVAPILEITMTKGNKTLNRRIKFSFVLPSKDDVKKAQSTATPQSKPTFDAINKLIDSKNDSGKGFKWTDLVKAGLSIFLAVA